MEKAIVGLAGSFQPFEGQLQGLAHLQRALEEVNRQGLRDGDDDDGYYDEKPPEGAISMAVAQEGLGEVSRWRNRSGIGACPGVCWPNIKGM